MAWCTLDLVSPSSCTYKMFPSLPAPRNTVGQTMASDGQLPLNSHLLRDTGPEMVAPRRVGRRCFLPAGAELGFGAGVLPTVCDEEWSVQSERKACSDVRTEYRVAGSGEDTGRPEDQGGRRRWVGSCNCAPWRSLFTMCIRCESEEQLSPTPGPSQHLCLLQSPTCGQVASFLCLGFLSAPGLSHPPLCLEAVLCL